MTKIPNLPASIKQNIINSLTLGLSDDDPSLIITSINIINTVFSNNFEVPTDLQRRIFSGVDTYLTKEVTKITDVDQDNQKNLEEQLILIKNTIKSCVTCILHLEHLPEASRKLKFYKSNQKMADVSKIIKEIEKSSI